MGKRLIIKGADFTTNGITAYKFIPVTTKTVKSSYTNNRLNVSNVIDVSAITVNTEYFIKVTSQNNKFNDLTLDLIKSKDSTYKSVVQFNIGNYASFKVEELPTAFLLQTREDVDTPVNGDDTLTISIYKRQELA